jgi:predicted TIM-barrel fold metal-dependent hydrolase
MTIFDAHYHVIPTEKNYNIIVEGKNIIFNELELYYEYKNKIKDSEKTTLIFDYKNNFDKIKSELIEGRLDGHKIHSRRQQLTKLDYPKLFEHFEEIASYKKPVVIDAFYFGDDLECQPSLTAIIQFAKKFKDNTVVIAHSGGYRVLEYLQHLRHIPNIVFELSFSLSYLKHSSVWQDYKLLIRFADRSRIIFGTDFPYIDAKDQLETFLDIATDLKIGDTDVEKMLFLNAKHIFSS